MIEFKTVTKFYSKTLVFLIRNEVGERGIGKTFVFQKHLNLENRSKISGLNFESHRNTDFFQPDISKIIFHSFLKILN